MTHLQLEEQTPKDVSRPPSTPTSHYDQRMVKAGDYSQASGQSRMGGEDLLDGAYLADADTTAAL